MPRIIIITNGNYFACRILEGIFSKHSLVISGVAIINGDYKGNTGLKALWSIGSATERRYFAYKLTQYAAFNLARRAWRRVPFQVEDLCERHDVPMFHASKVNSKEVLEFVASSDPDLIVSVSCPQKISQGILDQAEKGGINIHSSLLPAYAGLAPYYWVLSKGETQTGTTVHYMTQKFDEGNILVQKRLPIESGISAFKLFSSLADLGNQALSEAVDMAISGDPGRPQDLSKKSYFSHPTTESYRELRSNGFRIMRLREMWETIRKEVRNA